MRSLWVVGICSLFLFLQGCGGGSGSTSTPTTPAPSPTPTPPPSNQDPIIISGPASALRGEAVGLAVTMNSATQNTRFQWIQTSGPDVRILASHSQAIGFDVPESGDYSFEVIATNSLTQEELRAVHEFSVSETPKTLKIRLDHAVVEQGPVSLRVDVPPGESISALTWRQVSGPTIATNDLTQQDHFLFFDAPNVLSDQLLEFQATVTTASGINDTDNVYVMVKNATISDSGYFPDVADSVVNTEMFAYNEDSPYASALAACVYNNTISSSCQFSQLPLIGQVTNNPTIDDVLDRLWVSHAWMGDRFKEYLENSIASQDMLALLRGVTAIVISYEVRPSFYWVATGAIYLDARNFWVTPEERDTLNDIPDYRAGFGSDLTFIMPWRYVRNGTDYLNRSAYPQANRLTRSFADVEADITWLMYHELAHANDFFPPDRRQSIALTESPLSYFSDNEARSTPFAEQFPLRSEEMKGLADVRFRGNDANNAQRAYQADDIEVFFAPDDAAMFYSYLTTREDYATLFERFMMAYRFDAFADTAILSRIDNPNLLITWGQRNRIMESSIQPRTLYSVSNIYPELPASDIIQTLPAAQNMTPGTGWFDNLIIDKNRQRSGKSMEGFGLNSLLHHHHDGRPDIPKR